MSYQWQIRGILHWRDLPSNQEIERDYCNPANTQRAGSTPINFSTMTCGLSKVRRLSTGNTKWVWYWKEAEGKWREYEISEWLETRYLAGEKTLAFTIGIHQYVLRFSDMVQKNIKTKMERQVRRRPLLQNAPSGIPRYWDPNLLPSVGYEKIKLKMSSEYSTILRLFNRTMQGPGWNILSIQRIQNLLLWNFFKLQKDDMKAKAGEDVDERFLFHGTNSKHVDAICRDNIDWRMYGKNGTSYGEGSYFARDAKYSNSYTSKHGTKSMFVCRVLVGDFTKGEKHYKKPPLKDEQQSIPFDSCVNHPDNPSVFVIFEKSQIYPQYLIQYIDVKEEMNPESSLLRPSVPANASHSPSPAVASSGVLSSSDASKSTPSATLPPVGPSGTVQLAPQKGQREALSDSFSISSVSNQNFSLPPPPPPPPPAPLPQPIPTTGPASLTPHSQNKIPLLIPPKSWSNTPPLSVAKTKPVMSSPISANASQLPSSAVAARNGRASSSYPATDSTASPTLPPAGSSSTVQQPSQNSQRETFSNSLEFSPLSNQTCLNLPARPALPPPPPIPPPPPPLPPPPLPPKLDQADPLLYDLELPYINLLYPPPPPLPPKPQNKVPPPKPIKPWTNAPLLPLAKTKPVMSSPVSPNACQLPSPAVVAGNGRASTSFPRADESTVSRTLPPAGSSGTVQLTSQNSQRDTFSDKVKYFNQISNQK